MHSNSGSFFVSILDRFLLQNRRQNRQFSSRFFDVDFALLGKRFSVFCVSMVILRRSYFSRRTLGFLEGICFRAFARRQVKWLSRSSKIVLEIDEKSMKNQSKLGSKIVIFLRSVSRALYGGFWNDFCSHFGSQIVPKSDSKQGQKNSKQNVGKKVTRAAENGDAASATNATRDPVVP